MRAILSSPGEPDRILVDHRDEPAKSATAIAARPKLAAVAPAVDAKKEAEPPTPQQRRDLCIAEIQAALAKHGCRIVAFLGQPEPVGHFGERAILSASFAVVANQTQNP